MNIYFCAQTANIEEADDLLRRVAEAARNVVGERLFPDPDNEDLEDEENDEELDELDLLFEYGWQPLDDESGEDMWRAEHERIKKMLRGDSDAS